MKRSTSFVHRNSEKFKSSKSIANQSSFYQKIRQKLSFLKAREPLSEVYDDDNNEEEEFVFESNPYKGVQSSMHRSVTDASGIYLAKQPMPLNATEPLEQHANAVNHTSQDQVR